MYLISKIVILDMGIQLLLSYLKKVVNWFKVKNIDSIKYKAVIVEDSLTIINKNSDIMRHTRACLKIIFLWKFCIKVNAMPMKTIIHYVYTV